MNHDQDLTTIQGRWCCTGGGGRASWPQEAFGCTKVGARVVHMMSAIIVGPGKRSSVSEVRLYSCPFGPTIAWCNPDSLPWQRAKTCIIVHLQLPTSSSTLEDACGCTSRVTLLISVAKLLPVLKAPFLLPQPLSASFSVGLC